MLATAWAGFTGLLSMAGLTSMLGGVGGLIAAGVALYAGVRAIKSLAIIALVGAVAVLGFGTTFYLKGAAHEREKCQTANLLAEIDNLNRQKAAWEATMAGQEVLEEQRAHDMETIYAQLNAATALAGSLSLHTDNACPIALTADELRLIAEIGKGVGPKADAPKHSWWPQSLSRKANPDTR